MDTSDNDTAVTPGLGTNIGDLPNEVILEIIGHRNLSARGLVSLACTSKLYHEIVIKPAYRRHVETKFGLAIYWAIQNEQHGTLKRLVDCGVDVNMHDNQGRLLNTYDLFAVHDIWQTKASIDWRFDAYVAPLAWAASLGRDSMVEYLLDRGAHIEQDSSGLCDCHCELLRCQRLLPDRPVFYEDPPETDEDNPFSDYVDSIPDSDSDWTPLHYAICNRHDSTARLLLERGASAHRVGCGVTALHVAARWGVEDTIHYLIDEKLVDIDAQNGAGVTALHLAYVAGRYDLVDVFLECDADINLAYSERSGPWTIFAMACADESFDRALQYLGKGADPHFVLRGDYEDPWTVMRFIYGYRGGQCAYPLGHIDARMALEREIIAGGRVES
ncbi:hypothetical protein Daus18300_010518 [Diaporthe australafricana]|uniref:Ankyrin repeat protein n=1 Tax=Diaporthe australafricana TaxID=127596 RepID=A0ABR3WA49_9PEZI